MLVPAFLLHLLFWNPSARKICTFPLLFIQSLVLVWVPKYFFFPLGCNPVLYSLLLRFFQLWPFDTCVLLTYFFFGWWRALLLSGAARYLLNLLFSLSSIRIIQGSRVSFIGEKRLETKIWFLNELGVPIATGVSCFGALLENRARKYMHIYRPK